MEVLKACLSLHESGFISVCVRRLSGGEDFISKLLPYRRGGA